MVAGDVRGLGHAWLRGGGSRDGGCAWLWGMCGCRGLCVVAEGHAWWQGGMHGIRQDAVNEQVVHILLECILDYVAGTFRAKCLIKYYCIFE